MFDFGWSEIALIGVVALLFIGPKDMPVAIRTITNLLKKGRKLAGEFQSHVDEMVREADLGEARDQFRQLRSLNVRGQVMKALDADGSLQRTFDQKPLASIAPAGPRLAPAASSEPAVPVPAEPLATPLSTYTLENRPTHGIAAGDHGWVNAGAAPPARAAPVPAGELETAPQIIPPQVARRLGAERAQAQPPSFLPPRPVHANAVRPTRDRRDDMRTPGPY